jgi:hypothetical protein
MNDVYQLKIELIGSEPLIWRRVQVPAASTLSELHEVIQTAMGWEGYHLHQFEIGGRRYASPGEDSLGGEVDERNERLGGLVTGAGQSFRYEYDFGDGWEHLVTVESVEPAHPALGYPVCLGGQRACPPEDCGGIWRYNETRDAYADPQREEHAALLEWLGYPFDPEGFDTNAINRALHGRFL